MSQEYGFDPGNGLAIGSQTRWMFITICRCISVKNVLGLSTAMFLEGDLIQLCEILSDTALYSVWLDLCIHLFLDLLCTEHRTNGVQWKVMRTSV